MQILFKDFDHLFFSAMAPSVGEDAEEKEDKGEEILLNVIRPDYERPPPPPPMEPLYKPTAGGKVQGRCQKPVLFILNECR